MTDRRTSPLVKALAWFFAIVAVLGIIAAVSGQKDHARKTQEAHAKRAAIHAERQAEYQRMADEALAAMTPEEREALEASRKAENEEFEQRRREVLAMDAAVLECREAVRRNLHDPRSVQWDDSPGWAREVQPDGVIRIQPRYRAKNLMGALGHEVVNCYVDNERGTVRIAKL